MSAGREQSERETAKAGNTAAAVATMSLKAGTALSPAVPFSSRSALADDFWLPEFRDDPSQSPERLLHLAKKRRGRWKQREMVVTMKPPKEEGRRDFRLTAIHFRNFAATTPPCRCVACTLLCSTSLHSDRDKQRQMADIEIVDHGRHKFTIYDKTRPWERFHVEQCTNPRPWSRRLPNIEEDRSDVVNEVYRLQMLRPGKIIKDVKKQTSVA